MAKIRVVCPQCKRSVSPPGVPKPNDALLCEHCGASFPVRFASPTNASIAADSASSPAKSSIIVRNPLPIAAICAVVVAAIGFGVWSHFGPAREKPIEGIAAPAIAETSKNDDRKPEPAIEGQPQIKKTDDNIKQAPIAKDDSTTTAPTVKPEPASMAEPPKDWRKAVAILSAVTSVDGKEHVKPVAVATAVGPKQFVTRALPVLTTGIKNPLKDDTKLVLTGLFGSRPVVKVGYHRSLPIAKLADGKLEPEDYLAMMLHDAALLTVEESVQSLSPADFLKDGSSVSGQASVVGIVGNAPTSSTPNAAAEFQLIAAVVGTNRKASSSSLADVQCEAGPTMEGAAVFFDGRMAGLLLVNLDAAGKPAGAHGLLPAARLNELLAQP